MFRKLKFNKNKISQFKINKRRQNRKLLIYVKKDLKLRKKMKNKKMQKR